jgi:hypothetical protein
VACIPCILSIIAVTLLLTLGIDALKQFLKFDDSRIFGIHLNQSWFGWLLAVTALLITIVGATTITLLHGLIVRRLTLALFRLYLAAVSFGVGILSCLFLVLSLRVNLLTVVSSVSAAISCLVTGFALAYLCFKSASSFRGSYPHRFAVVSADEFNKA